MKSLWNEKEAAKRAHDPLALRVYSSRLLGGDPELVLHGGGNTSVKTTVTDLFGDPVEVLYVKGSGWDLGTIEAPGFAPVRLDTLIRMAQLDDLSDTDMVKNQRAAMLNPNAPNPSVEAILHAIIPFTFVDHTHTDAIVTMTNTCNGEARIREHFGPNMLIVPYVMPGFILAKTIYDMTSDFSQSDWEKLDGMVLLNHGLFTFANDAKSSYEKHIHCVTQAEEYLTQHAPVFNTISVKKSDSSQNTATDLVPADLLALARLRKAVSDARGSAIIARVDQSFPSAAFANLPNVADIGTRGLLTPDHVIRTKRVPLVLSGEGKSEEKIESKIEVEDRNKNEKIDEDMSGSVELYTETYKQYFNEHNHDNLTILDTAPRWAIWPGRGTITFGRTPKEVTIIEDIKRHTQRAIQSGEALGGWHALGPQDIFDVEYWELEQAKLAKGGANPPLLGKVAIVSGGASGIGRACVDALTAQGAVVASFDINPDSPKLFDRPNTLGIVCDVTDDVQLADAVAATVNHFGGLDILVLNAGIVPESQHISEMDPAMWDKTVAINLTSQQRLLTYAVPYLAYGVDAAVVVIASKNVPAPGPGLSAYSVTKAGITQLARVAALELAGKGVRVNVVHPNAVFDTALWTDEVLQQRADHYGMTIEEYKANNLLTREVRSSDVAEMVCAMAGPIFSRTTGAQVPIDGGNDRVI